MNEQTTNQQQKQMNPSLWRLSDSKLLRKFRVVTVLEDQYVNRETDERRSYVVCDSADWVLVIPITTDGKIVFVNQFRHGRKEFVLEIPGGVMEPDESPIETARRELMEETGFAANSIEICGSLLPNPALNNARIHVAIAKGCRLTSEPTPEPFELISVDLREMNDVAQMIQGGELQHARCIAAFTLAGIGMQPV